MRSRRTIAAIILLVVTACFMVQKWRRDEPRRHSIEALQDLNNAVVKNSSAILDKIVAPEALSGRTIAEQTEFLAKTLKDEISAEGIFALGNRASFGPLTKVFPSEAESWTKSLNINPEKCVAFKMERAGIRAEVVLLCEKRGYRILRCNNVRQMAVEGGHS